MSQLPSAYNFVPVPEGTSGVIYPEWASQVSHDVPFQDGLSGELELELKAESPIFIRASEKSNKRQQGKVHQPYTDHEGRYALPGSSLRGMLRSVVEIATWGKMGPVNDFTFGLRDLHTRHLYGDYMADVQTRKDTGKREPMTLVNAGWLYYDLNEEGEKEYYISPCNFARLEYSTLKKIIPSVDPNRRQSAAQKYKAWGEGNIEKEFTGPVRVLLEKGTISARSKLRRLSEFGEIKGPGTARAGRVVFTGQPQNRREGERRKKHHDFFFYGHTGDQDLKVEPEQMRAFELIHSSGAEQHADTITPNDEWKFWRKQLHKKGAISINEEPAKKRCVPVFFIIEKDFKKGQPVLRSFGLAMMFRLAYDQSVHDLRKNTQGSFDRKRRDFAELIFGHVNNDKNERTQGYEELDPRNTLRGRVSIGHARVVGKAELAKPVKAVLSAPKPTYYPAYITQGSGPGDNPQRQRTGRGYLWTAYMKEQKPQLRGWKQYLAHNSWERSPKLPDKAGESVMTTFQPVKEGAVFRFKIRVHNLRPVELGALMWAINFGGAPEARHLIGMAKSLGYGKSQLRVVRHALIRNSDLDERSLSDAELNDTVKQFRAYMNKRTNNTWASSPTIRELIVCATPHPSGRDPEHLRAPLLNHPRLRNEFQHYKKEGKALPLHSSDRAYEKIISALKRRERGEG